jgi:hypothetical protein
MCCRSPPLHTSIAHPSMAHAWYMSIVGGDVWGGDMGALALAVRFFLTGYSWSRWLAHLCLGDLRGHARSSAFIGHPFSRSPTEPAHEHPNCGLPLIPWYLHIACSVIPGQLLRGPYLPAVGTLISGDSLIALPWCYHPPYHS